MALSILGLPKLMAQPLVDESGLEEQIISGEYALGPLSLSDANLENGDWLPADAEYGIVASTWEIVGKSRRVFVPETGQYKAIVRARAVRAWETSGP